MSGAANHYTVLGFDNADNWSPGRRQPRHQA